MISPFWMNNDLQPGLETFIHNFSRDKNSFPVQLKNFNSFKPRVIFVNVEHSASLLQLKTALENELTAGQNYPIKKETRPFHPHITIANRDLLKKDYYTAWEHFKNKQYDDNFLVTGLSLLKHNGTVWETVFTTNFPD
jgi:2'-5' RNA ligase